MKRTLFVLGVSVLFVMTLSACGQKTAVPQKAEASKAEAQRAEAPTPAVEAPKVEVKEIILADFNSGAKPNNFGLILDLVAPPRGVVVTYLPTGYRTVFIGGTAYYEYDNVYYQPSSGGYVVVQPPVAANDYVSPNVVYAPVPYVATPTQPSEGEPVTVNVRTSRRGTIAITLMRYSNGFVGPQGEFYPSFPTTNELRARYDR